MSRLILNPPWLPPFELGKHRKASGLALPMPVRQPSVASWTRSILVGGRLQRCGQKLIQVGKGASPRGDGGFIAFHLDCETFEMEIVGLRAL